MTPAAIEQRDRWLPHYYATAPHITITPHYYTTTLLHDTTIPRHYYNTERKCDNATTQPRDHASTQLHYILRHDATTPRHFHTTERPRDHATTRPREYTMPLHYYLPQQKNPLLHHYTTTLLYHYTTTCRSIQKRDRCCSGRRVITFPTRPLNGPKWGGCGARASLLLEESARGESGSLTSE